MVSGFVCRNLAQAAAFQLDWIGRTWALAWSGWRWVRTPTLSCSWQTRQGGCLGVPFHLVV